MRNLKINYQLPLILTILMSYGGKHNINGLIELLVILNNQLNDVSDNKVDLAFGSQLNTLPKGKSW